MNMSTPNQLMPELHPSVRLHWIKNTRNTSKDCWRSIQNHNSWQCDRRQCDRRQSDRRLCNRRQCDSWRCTSLCAFLFSVIWLLASAPKSSNIPWISSNSSPMLIHPISNLHSNNEHTVIEKIWVASSGTLYFRGIPRPPASLGRGSPQH